MVLMRQVRQWFAALQATTTVGLASHRHNFGVVAYRSIVIEIKAPKIPTILRPFPVTTDLTPFFTWDGESKPTFAGCGQPDTVRTVSSVSNLTTTTTHLRKSADRQLSGEGNLNEWKRLNRELILLL